MKKTTSVLTVLRPVFQQYFSANEKCFSLATNQHQHQQFPNFSINSVVYMLLLAFSSTVNASVHIFLLSEFSSWFDLQAAVPLIRLSPISMFVAILQRKDEEDNNSCLAGKHGLYRWHNLLAQWPITASVHTSGEFLRPTVVVLLPVLHSVKNVVDWGLSSLERESADNVLQRRYRA